jgi:hypothetical protein
MPEPLAIESGEKNSASATNKEESRRTMPDRR